MAYSNLDPFEGIATSSTLITLSRRSRHLQITNDAAAADLLFRFAASAPWATLRPTETVSMHVWVTKVYLSGIGVPYRVWSYG